MPPQEHNNQLISPIPCARTLTSHQQEKMARTPTQGISPAMSIVSTPPPQVTPTTFASPGATNEKGELLTWSSRSEDGVFLQMMYESGALEGMTASQVRVKFPQLQKYSCRALNNAIGNERKKKKKAVEARQSLGEQGKLFILLCLLLCFNYVI